MTTHWANDPAVRISRATSDRWYDVAAVMDIRADPSQCWCQFGPKGSYPRLAASPIARPPKSDPDPEGLWAITCFVVTHRFRGRGIAARLLDRAMTVATEAGADTIEGYPVDTAGSRQPPADLYHGTVSQFAAAGFTEARRPTARRAVMRYKVA